MINTLIFLRHGRTAYNKLGRIQGQIDIPLDIVGRWQAQTSARALSERLSWASVAHYAHHHEELLDISGRTSVLVELSDYDSTPAASRSLLAFSSDLSRAYETARACTDSLHIPLVQDTRLRERSYGQCEGKTHAEISEIDPQGWHSWGKVESDQRFGMETVHEVSQRGLDFVNELVASQADSPLDTTGLIVAHGAFIICTLAGLLDVDIHTFINQFGSIRNACWCTIELTQPRPIARFSLSDEDSSLPEEKMRWKITEFNAGPQESASASWQTGPSWMRVENN